MDCYRVEKQNILIKLCGAVVERNYKMNEAEISKIINDYEKNMKKRLKALKCLIWQRYS